MRAQIAEWRRRLKDGQLTREESKRIIELLRGDRTAAAQTSTASRKAKGPIDVDGILDKLV